MGNLGGFAGELACFEFPVCLRIRLFTDFAVRKFTFFLNDCISAISPNLKEKVLHVGLKPKNMRVEYRHTPDTNEARGFQKS
jgi:hypothetical protein